MSTRTATRPPSTAPNDPTGPPMDRYRIRRTDRDEEVIRAHGVHFDRAGGTLVALIRKVGPGQTTTLLVIPAAVVKEIRNLDRADEVAA